MQAKLLTRTEFRNGVFARDKHVCVFCGQPATAAHHIVDRALFSDGGYYLENGVSVCDECHLACERTVLSTNEVRAAAKITKVVLPEHFETDQTYDKWGNPVLADGRRLRGEMFFEPSVQRMLTEGGVLDQFTSYVKYPRTMHLPWSLGRSDDDKVIPDLSGFVGKRVIVTEKMDGENTSLYSDHMHARSLDSRHHSSRDWVKAFWSGFKHDIPEGWRVCGENMYARHSIAYSGLKTYFYGFSVWNATNECLSWDDTLVWFELLGITPAPTLYDGIWDETVIKGLYDPKTDSDTHEGYVVRIADGFSLSRFRSNAAKYVREKHVQTNQHWMHAQIVKNELAV